MRAMTTPPVKAVNPQARRLSEHRTSTYDESFSPAFQAHIFAIILKNPRVVMRYRSAIKPEFFPAGTMRQVMEVYLAHVDANRIPPTFPTLCQELAERFTDGYEDLVKTADAAYKSDTSDMDAVCGRLVEFAKVQAAVNAVVRGAEDLDKRNDRSNLLRYIQEAQIVGEDLMDMGLRFDANYDREEEYKRAARRWIVPTGITEFDDILDGGPERGELHVVLAPPKVGKTTFLVNLAFSMLTSVHPLNVLYISNEMSDRKIRRRFDDRLAGPDIVYKRTDVDEYLRRLNVKHKKHIRGNLVVRNYPTRTCTPTMLRSYLATLAAQGFVPDVLIVDYADIMKPERRTGEMRHEQAGIYEDLRGIAGEFNLVCWTASQGNRSSTEKPILNFVDFAESFEKAAILDGGWALCQTEEEKASNRMRVFAMGIRGHEGGQIIDCNILRDRCAIEPLGVYDGSMARLDNESEAAAGVRRSMAGSPPPAGKRPLVDKAVPPAPKQPVPNPKG